MIQMPWWGFALLAIGGMMLGASIALVVFSLVTGKGTNQ